MRRVPAAAIAVLLGLATPSSQTPVPQPLPATSCERLASVRFPDATVTSASTVPAGAFVPPAGSGIPGRGARGAAPAGPQNAAVTTLPSFCRVTAVLTPSSDSHIEMELWLPLANWNGRFQAVGNGGWAGTIAFGTPAGRSLADAVRRGYAAAATDTGHQGGNAQFAIGHPEKLVDFAHRAVHEMTVKSKTLLTRFYGRAADFSYWNGCSTGGRQGLMAAQRYPADFDGIIAGAPANSHSRLHAWDLSVAVPALTNPASVVPAAKLTMLNGAVMRACDATDGITDGILNDPRACPFDPATQLCRDGDNESCLTTPQVESVRRMYSYARTSSGSMVFAGKERGTEASWMAISGGTQPAAVSLGTFQVAYQDLNWDWKTFNLDRDLRIADEKVGRIVDAVDPDLSAFKARGGKLILYHGWNDVAISPGNTVDYYQSVLSRLGPQQSDWLRLYMAPGMGHCGGGPGPNDADFVQALERWRESGIAPDRIIASRRTGNAVDMTRPLCPYPQLATYTGAGSTSDASNFVCKAR